MIINFEKEYGFALKNVEFVLNFWDNLILEYPNTSLIATKGNLGPFLTTTFKINKVSGQYFNEFENRFGSFENDIKSQIDFFKWSHKGYPSLSVPNDELIFNNEIPIFQHASYSIKDPFQGEINIPWPEGIPIKIQEFDESIKNKNFKISPEVMAGLPYLIGRAKYAKKIFSKYNQTPNKDENQIYNNLVNLGFEDYLTDHNIDKEKIKSILLKIIDQKERLPFQIAVLFEIKFIDYFINNNEKNKTEMQKVLAKALMSPERRVRGNISVLIPNSKEKKEEYTSHLHIDEIKELLDFN